MQGRWITWAIACVWLINGLVCKILNLVPRHQLIVAEILGAEHSRIYTILIGIGEVLMGCWILTEIKARYAALVQITLVATMNLLEFFLCPDLLLWGRLNIFFALLFIVMIYFHWLSNKSPQAV